MAFGSDNDIRLKVTLDDQEAIRAAEELKKKLAGVANEAAAEFSKAGDALKAFGDGASKAAGQSVSKLNTELNKTSKSSSELLKKIKEIASTGGKDIDGLKKTTEDVGKGFTKSAKDADALLKKIKQIGDEALATSDKRNRASKSSQGGDESGAGALLDKLGGTGGGGLLGMLGKLNPALGTMAAGLYIGKTAFNAVSGAIDGTLTAVRELVQESSRLEGFKSAFNILATESGKNPISFIQELRTATSGLISDTQLYQRANQALLLNVPADLFVQSAAAATKLGKAMGVDAANGLESLSLGLGRQSRLYLDNLGIVVSATEAYKKFADANNLNADALTDSEKRAAFFAEALEKLRSKAESLPEPFDTAGNAMQRLSAAQENARASQLELFNSNETLIKGLNELRGAIPAIQPTMEALTTASASISGSFLNAAAAALRYAEVLGGSTFRAAVAGATDLVAGFNNMVAKRLKRDAELLGNLFPSSETKELKSYEASVTKIFNKIQSGVDTGNINEAIAQAVKDVNALDNELGSIGGPKFPATTKKVQEELRKISDTILEVRKSSKELQQLVPDNALGVVAAPVNKKALEEEARVRAEALDLSEKAIRDMNQRVQESVGDIQIPGFSDDAVTKYRDNLESVALAYKNAAINKEEYAKRVNQANQELLKLGGRQFFDKSQLDQVEKVQQAAISKVDKQISDSKRDGKKAARDSAAELKRQEREIDDFVRSVSKKLDNTIPYELENQLISLFTSGVEGTREFDLALRDIGERARALQVPLGEVAKKASEIGKVRQQGGFGPGNNPGIAEFQDQQKALEKLKEDSLPFSELIGNLIGLDGKEAIVEGDKIAAQLAGVLQSAFSSLVSGDFGVTEAFTTAGAVIGIAIGAAIGQAAGAAIGAALGSAVGQGVGSLVESFRQPSEKRKAQQAVDEYFNDLFNSDRLSAIINGQLVRIRDFAIRNSSTMGQGIGSRNAGIGFSSPDDAAAAQARRDQFNADYASVQDAFNGVGAAFEQMLEVGDELSGELGRILAENIGANLQNLQILVQQTGKSFIEMGDAVMEAFYNGTLSIEEAYQALKRMEDLFTTGIPGAIGAVQEAFDNFNRSLAEGKGSRYLIDSFRDIAAEAYELGDRTVGDFVNRISTMYGLTADQTAMLLESLKKFGISNIQDVADASSTEILGLIRDLERIKAGQTPDSTPIKDPTENRTPPTNFARAQYSSGKKDKSGKDKADELKRQKDELYGLLQASTQYEEILKKLNAGLIDNKQAGEDITKLYRDISVASKRLADAEARYRKELEKGRKASAARLGSLADAITEAQKKFDELTKKAEKTEKVLDLKNVVGLIKDMNTLGLVARQVGVSLETNVSILVRGFLQGRLSIQQVNDEIRKTNELMGKGIPKAVGAVDEAFKNLIKGGTQGGIFSVDAFQDIFAEFREKFQKESSAARGDIQASLIKELDTARDNFQKALSGGTAPKALDELRIKVETARKALEDFYSSPAKPALVDLRQELEKTFERSQVDIFFRALDESGINTFDGLEGASNEAIIGILGKLSELGFQFQDTSSEVKGVTDGLVDAEKAANGGLDPLGDALDLVKQFNAGAQKLPPVFDATRDSISAMGEPLAKLADGFQIIVDKLAKMGGNTFTNDVVFNVRIDGDPAAKGIADVLYGDGSGLTESVSVDMGGGGSGLSDSAKARKSRRLQYLKGRKNRSRADNEEIRRLQKELGV